MAGKNTAKYTKSNSKEKIFEDVISDVKNLLIDSVKKCMISDLKLEHFYQDGIDSTLISCVLILNKNNAPFAFYIGFNEKGFR